MRLTDLDPRWLIKNGKRVGFIFRCPLEPANDRIWQSCFFEPTPHTMQWSLFEQAGSEQFRWIVQGCKETIGWKCTPAPEQATFNNISIKPSIDGSAGGNWHGHITNGEIKGGI